MATGKQFFLILNGPSCGGKSSVADIMQSKVPQSFNARRDKVKWLISDFASTKYEKVLDEMMSGLIETAIKHKLSVITEGMPQPLTQYKALCEKYDATLVVANISAPKDVLYARFEKRVAAKTNAAKIVNVNPARFEELRQFYETNKHVTELEFDSSVLSSDEIVEKVLEYIKENS